MALVAIVVACGAIEDDELKCEEGASRLETCCPGFNPQRLNCQNQQGCNTSLVPVITERASDCLRAKTCEEIVTKGSCELFRQLSLSPSQFQQPEDFEAEACR